MKARNLLVAVIAVTLICLLAVGVLAQRGPARLNSGCPAEGPGMGPGGPGGPGNMPHPSAKIEAGSQGAFILLGGTLLKYDATTLEQTGSLVLVEKSTDEADDSERPLPPPRGVMKLADGDSETVVAVIGDQFFSVDAASLSITAQATIPALEVEDEDADDQAPRPMGPCGLELQGSTAYVMTGPQIVAIDINSGTVTGKTVLPKPEDQ